MSVSFVIALQFLNMTGVHAVRTLLTLYALALGAGPVAIGVLAAAFGVIPIAFSWLSGRLYDRFGPRWIMLFGLAGGAGGILLPYFMPSVPTILIAALLNGLATTFCSVPLQTLVGVLSTPENRAKNYSNFSLSGSLTTFVGPLSAGYFIEFTGHANACLFIIALAAVPIAMLLSRGGELPGGAEPAAARGSLRDMLREPGVWRSLSASALGQVSWDVFQFYIPVYAHAAGLSASTIGWLLAAFAAAAFFARFWLPRLVAASNELTVLAYTFGVAALAFAVVPFCHTAPTIALVSFLTGLGLGCVRPISMMLMFTPATRGRTGEAMGLRLTAENVTRMVAPVLFGMIASAAGLAAVFWINALLMGSGGAYMRRGADSHA
jgi:MFS family permease